MKELAFKFKGKEVFISIVIALMLAYYINPLIDVDITDWNRSFGPAVLEGISIDKRITNFYLLFLIYIPILFLFINFLMNLISRYRSKYVDLIYNLCCPYLIYLVVAYLSRYSSYTKMDSNDLLFVNISYLLITIIVAYFDKLEKNNEVNITRCYLIYLIGIMSFNVLFKFEHETSLIVVSFLVVIYNIFFLNAKHKIVKYKSVTDNIISFLLWIPCCIFVSLQAIYILVEKGFYITNYETIVQSCVVILLIIGFVISFLLKEMGELMFGCIGALCSIICFNRAMVYQQVVDLPYIQLYEWGNRTVVTDTIINGRLPIVDYFSAHALSDVIFNFFYGAIDKDMSYIWMNPFSFVQTCLTYIIIFCFIERVFDKEKAVLFVVLMPIVNNSWIIGLSWSLLIVYLLTIIIEKRRNSYYILFWITALFIAFMRYDEGISLGIGCIVAYVVLLVFEKRKEQILQFIGCGVFIGGIALSIYFIYAYITEMNPFHRVLEWLHLSIGSDAIWATAGFGNPSSFEFTVSYFVVPMMVIAIIFSAIVLYSKKPTNTLLFLLTIAFAIAEVMYLPRTIIFHNLEVCLGRSGVLLNVIHFSIAFFVLFYNKQKGKIDKGKEYMIWVFAFMGTILLECTLVTGLTFKTTNVAAANALNTSEYLELRNGVQENIGQSRVVFSDDTSELIESFDLVFDMLLEDDETFLDFANITSLYTLVDRQRPFYVAQSPSLLTDEYTQEQYLEQIKEYKIPLVIMGETESGYIAQLYGIQHSVRYYKVAEHIYQNYRPLLKFGEFSIWCMKENYDEYVDVVRNNNLKEFVVIDYGYDETIVELDENAETVEVYSYKHENDLGQTAYIWANFDDKSASNNTVLDSLEMIDRNSFIFAGSQSVDRQTGNYILFEVSNSSDAIVEMDIKLEDSEKTQFSYKYTFDILPGDNKYIIRVSSDYFWYASNINKITFETVDNIGVQNLSVLKGD